ncbi:MAG TPA: AAA family ATPase [Verrucomicrobiae bacterium]|nr:AAA family ATPase [Verrucomicrobiae bacterium]
MNEDSAPAAHDRHAGGRKFYSKLQRYRNLLLRRWWVLAVCLVAALGIQALILRNAPPVFASVGQMIVNVRLNIQQSSLYTEELGNFIGTQQALMHSDQVLNRARERVASQSPGLNPQPVGLDVAVLPKTTIFLLRASGGNPEYTKAFLQACMEAFQNLKKGMAERASDSTIAGLTDQMLRLDPEMKKVDDQIASFLSTNNVTLLEEATGAANYLSLLYQRLAEARSDYDLLQSMNLDQNLLLEQDRTPAMAGAGFPSGLKSDNGLLANAALGGQSTLFAPSSIGMEYLSIKQQLLLLKAEQDRFGEYLKPKHPKMVEMAEQSARLDQLLGIYKDQSLEQLEAKKSALALQIKNLESETKELGEQNVQLGRKNAEYSRMKAKGERLQSLYDQLLATLQTLDVNKDISPDTVTIYQPASDAFPVDPLQAKKLLTAAIVGLGLGLAMLLLLDRLDDRMSSFTELEELFDEDVLGQIPREKSPDKNGAVPLLQPGDPRHPFLEAYRNLRSSLLYTAETGSRPHTLLITSSVPNDGKSVTAANLAITLAAGGSRVLLVDADLRKGTQHSRFKIQADTGLSETLTQGLDWHSAVKETFQDKLFLLPRGAIIHHSSEAFIGPVMEKFLQETIKEYDYVLIDTAPVMAADDVTSLAPRVDGVIFVVRAEFTSARVARTALDMLA